MHLSLSSQSCTQSIIQWEKTVIPTRIDYCVIHTCCRNVIRINRFLTKPKKKYWWQISSLIVVGIDFREYYDNAHITINYRYIWIVYGLYKLYLFTYIDSIYKCWKVASFKCLIRKIKLQAPRWSVFIPSLSFYNCCNLHSP